MINICICDSSINTTKTLSQIIENHLAEINVPFQIFVYHSGLKLLDDIETGKRFDILFAEVLMPGLNGIEVCREIRELDRNCKIVFVSSSREFGVESYEVEASNYLLKPINEKLFVSCLDKLVGAYLSADDFVLTVKTKSGIRSIKYRDIFFLESEKHQIRLITANGEEIVFYGSMSDYQELLEKDIRFLRCHKGYIINMQHVTAIQDKEFVINNKHFVPIPKTSIGKIKATYFEFILTFRNA